MSKGHPSSSQSSNAKYNPCLPKARWWRKRSKETISLKGCLFCCFFFLTPPLNHLKAECTRIILLRPETKAWVSQTSLYLKKKKKKKLIRNSKDEFTVVLLVFFVCLNILHSKTWRETKVINTKLSEMVGFSHFTGHRT